MKLEETPKKNNFTNLFEVIKMVTRMQIFSFVSKAPLYLF